MADTIAARLAAVGSAIGEIPLAATTLDAVNAVILDWCGATIGGSNGATARVLMAGLASAGGPQPRCRPSPERRSRHRRADQRDGGPCP